MKRFGLNSGYIGVDRRRDEAGIAPLQKAYLERIRGGNYSPVNFLLNTYSGAAAAYSLRLLSGNYTGNAIRVRRSLDNAELDIGFVGAGLDTNTLASFCSGTDGFVTAWYDQSGNQRNLQQATLLSQPQIVYSGTILLYNGTPAINSATNRNLVATSFTVDKLATPLAMFVVTVLPTGPDRGMFEFSSADNSGVPRFTVTAASTTIKVASPGYFINAPRLPSVYNLVSITRESNNWSVFLNTSLAGTGVAGLSGVAPLRVFSGYPAYYNSIIQELIFYPYSQSANRPEIESNINSYYNIY